MSALPVETPPLTRGRRSERFRSRQEFRKHPRLRGEDWIENDPAVLAGGNTPAYAGKTMPFKLLPEPSPETPPLTRGRRLPDALQRAGTRNTPAYAGKTKTTIGTAHFPQETPPLTRGRLDHMTDGTLRQRNTPAYAGKTIFTLEGIERYVETPPLTRGRPSARSLASFSCRNTPAYAGKTRCEECRKAFGQKHPRLRGEDWELRWEEVPVQETPPLTRGRPGDKITSIRPNRNTPAYAGKTKPRAVVGVLARETPPLTRGRHELFFDRCRIC
mgnify:CR=1 FL=1